MAPLRRECGTTHRGCQADAQGSLAELAALHANATSVKDPAAHVASLEQIPWVQELGAQACEALRFHIKCQQGGDEAGGWPPAPGRSLATWSINMSIDPSLSPEVRSTTPKSISAHAAPWTPHHPFLGSSKLPEGETAKKLRDGRVGKWVDG
eukprot:366074-Chlamydomonas_euryale.AAC.12